MGKRNETESTKRLITVKHKNGLCWLSKPIHLRLKAVGAICKCPSGPIVAVLRSACLPGGLNCRAAALPLASLCFDRFLRPAAPMGAAGRRNPFRQPPPHRPFPSIWLNRRIAHYRSHCLFRQPPPPRFIRHSRRFGFGATGGGGVPEPAKWHILNATCGRYKSPLRRRLSVVLSAGDCEIRYFCS